MYTELQARYDTRKNFYGKTKTTSEINNTLDATIKRLYSYGTHVATITQTLKEYGDTSPVLTWVGGWYSQTTSRHINEFLQQNGLEKMTKKQMEQGGY